MLTSSDAPFGSVVLFDPAQAGRAKSRTAKARTATRRVPRTVPAYLFTECSPLVAGGAALCRAPREPRQLRSSDAGITSPSSRPDLTSRRATASPKHLLTPENARKCLHRGKLRVRQGERIRCRGDPRVRCPAGAPAPGAARLRDGAADPRGAPPDPVSDPPRPRRVASRVRARRADRDDAAAARPRRDPAAAPLRVRVLHGAPRAAPEPPPDLAPLDRSGRRDDRGRRGRRARGGGYRLGGVVRARRRRVADRSDRRHRDRAAARRPAPADRHRGGGEPGQRRDGARAAPDRAPRRRLGHVRRVVGELGPPRHDRRRDRRRARRRLRHPPGAASARQSAPRGDDRLPHRIPRVPARLGARRLGGAGGRHGRRLHGLVYAGADHRADAAPGTRVLGDPHVPPQRAALRARRTPAEPDPRRALGARHVGADRRRGGDRARGRCAAIRRRLRGDLCPARPVPTDPGA